jgi:hypothetical protein
MLQRIIVRFQTRLRELGAIDWTMSMYTQACKTGEKRCDAQTTDQDCPSETCQWSLNEENNPGLGGYCVGGVAETYCDGVTARTLEELVDTDTSTGFNSIVNSFADALSLISDAMPAGGSDHRTPPLLDFDQAFYDILGTDLKVRNARVCSSDNRPD